MRFVTHRYGEHENMCLLYEADAPAPETLRHVSVRYARQIIDPRKVTYVKASYGISRLKRKYSHLIPALYDDIPSSYKDLLASGFPYKTYASAQDMMADKQDPDKEYVSCALSCGYPAANGSGTIGEISLVNVYGTGVSEDTIGSLSIGTEVYMILLGATTGTSVAFSYGNIEVAGIKKSEGIQKRTYEITATSSKQPDGLVAARFKHGNLWREGQDPVPRSWLTAEQQQDNWPAWVLEFARDIDARPQLSNTQLAAYVYNTQIEKFERFAVTHVGDGGIKVARPLNDLYTVMM